MREIIIHHAENFEKEKELYRPVRLGLPSSSTRAPSFAATAISTSFFLSFCTSLVSMLLKVEFTINKLGFQIYEHITNETTCVILIRIQISKQSIKIRNLRR
jgi:hypothetical protein